MWMGWHIRFSSPIMSSSTPSFAAVCKRRAVSTRPAKTELIELTARLHCFLTLEVRVGFCANI